MKWLSFYIFFFIFYFWTVYPQLSLQNIHFNYYNLLADNLLKLNVEMPIKPSADLLALSNPYDPALNKDFRMHDLSLYKEKYYLYFGVVPALVFYAPFKLIFKGDLPDGIVVLTFCFGVFFFSVKILEHLKITYFKSTPDKIMGIGLRVLGFSSFAGVLLRAPEIYEVAVSGGLFFLTSAMYFLLKEIKKDAFNKKYLLLISSLLGLGCGCRPQIIIIGALLISILILISFLKKKFKMGDFLAITLPFLSFLIFIGFYNFIRFNNPFDFGAQYQLAAVKCGKDYFNITNLFSKIYLTLFNVPEINTSFPFIHVKEVKMENFTAQCLGILFALPFIWLNFILLFFLTKQNSFSKKDKKFPLLELYLLLLPVLINITLIFIMLGMAVRYLADFSVFLILASCIMWFYFGYENPIKNSKIFNRLSITLAILSILIGLALNIENPEAKLVFPSFSELVKKIKL